MFSRRNLLYLSILILVWAFPVWAFLTPDTPESSELTYTLDWDLSNVELLSGGWRTNNDLGYEITVTFGMIVSYETQLTACEHTHGWFNWASIPTVYAGHGDDGNDSTLSGGIVENIANPATQTWGTVTLYEPTYCEAFYLVARGGSDTVNPYDGLDMFGTSIIISGTYIAPDSTEAVPFTLETQHANGTVSDFLWEGQSVHLALSHNPMEITITRRLDTLFDEIDFANDDPDDMAFQVLRNLLNDTEFHVISGKTHIEK